VQAVANDGSGIYGKILITISYIINSLPVVVINYKSSTYSGFVSEINASGSYDANKDILTYTWTVPDNVQVSSTTDPIIKYLAPIVNSYQTIEFTLKISDGKTTQSKVIPIEILPYKTELEIAEIVNIEASSYQSPNLPYNIIDGDISTMWSAEGDNQWLILKLEKPYFLQHIIVAFNPGQKSESYFEILGSEDKVNWEPILTKSASCTFSGNPQVFEFPASKSVKKYCYVKLIGRCNSKNTWNFISELKIFGYSYQDSPGYEKLPVKIYPNPAREFVTIRIDDFTLLPDLIQIVDLSGIVNYRSEIFPDIREFTVPANFKNGIYFVQLLSGKITLFAQKLVVNK